MISKELVSAGKQTGISDKNSQSGSVKLDFKSETGSSNFSADMHSSSVSNQSSDKLEKTVGTKNKINVTSKDSNVTNKQSQAKIISNTASKDTPDSDLWSQNQQVILEWALRQYPKGTEQRWEKVAEHIPGKNKVWVDSFFLAYQVKKSEVFSEKELGI